MFLSIRVNEIGKTLNNSSLFDGQIEEITVGLKLSPLFLTIEMRLKHS